MEKYSSSKATTTVLLVAVAVMALAVTVAEGQPKRYCGSVLLLCMKYFNSTSKPPETCCAPVRQAATDNMPCLCSIFNSTAVIPVYNGTTNEAFRLAGNCGVSDADLGSCSTLAPPVRAWWGDVLPPPPPNSVDASHLTSWTKIWSFMMGVFFLWWSLMA